MRRTAAAVILAGSALWLGPQAGGSSLGRFQVQLRVIPIAVNVGAPVRVRFTAYSVTAKGRVLSDTWQFRLVAVSPTADRMRIRLRHVGRGNWAGAVRLREIGTWQIRVANWPSAGLGPVVKVKVREAPAPPASGP